MTDRRPTQAIWATDFKNSFANVFAVIAAVIFCFAAAANAATFTVTNNNDSGPGSLRQAIADADLTEVRDDIVFDPVSFSSPQTITLTSGQLEIRRPATFVGTGVDELTISGGDNFRVFYIDIISAVQVDPRGVEIRNLTIANGKSVKGGGLYLQNGFVLMEGCEVRNNTATGVNTADFLNAGGGIFTVNNSMRIHDSVIRDNLALGEKAVANATQFVKSGQRAAGGGIYNVRWITNSKIIHNTARGGDGSESFGGGPGGDGGTASGGGLSFDQQSLILNTTIADNEVIGGNGGNTNPANRGGSGGDAHGGGIENRNSLSMANSTVSGNIARGGNIGDGGPSSVPPVGGDSSGGGVYNVDNAMIWNSTFAGNSVSPGTGPVNGLTFGGGLSSETDGFRPVVLVNVTVTGNAANEGSGGGIYSKFQSNGAVLIRNTIIAANVGLTGKDVAGYFSSPGNNLIGTNMGAAGFANGVNDDKVGSDSSPIDPALGPLQLNGGLTETCDLLPSSPALDAGNHLKAANPVTGEPIINDQRGLNRADATVGTVDIGAVEFNSSDLPPPSRPDLDNTSDSGQSSIDNITNSTAPVFTIRNVAYGAVVELLRNGQPVASVLAETTTIALTDPFPPADASVIYTARHLLGAGTSAPGSAVPVTFDRTAPTVTINQAFDQADPTRLLPIRFTAIASERVSIAAVSLLGSTANVNFASFDVSSVDSMTLTISISGITSDGQNVIANIGRNGVKDVAGNSNLLPSTSVDNSVTVDNVGPTVTVNQAPGQSDPTSQQPVNFSVVFSDSVTGFTASDISFTGSTANIAAANVFVTGAGSKYNVAVSNIRSRGIVRVRILAGAAQDSIGNSNSSSVSSDNAITVNKLAQFDYDSDGRADLSVRRPSDNIWYIQRGTAGYFNIEFGVPGDQMAPADYDGDGKTDIAVFRPSNGTWYIFNSSSQSFTNVTWGADGDLPVPADHDGDGKADLVVFRPSTNTWYTRFSSNSTFSSVGFGVAGDKPVIGDFDGDGRSDIALYRPSESTWYILKTGFGFFVQTWGEAGDIPVPADYDGDGKTDVAVFRPSTGQWFRIRSTAGFDTVNWGADGDVPIHADYDGDGKSDVAVFRPSNSNWYIVGSTSGQLIQQYGIEGDVPTEAAFNR